MGIRVSTAAAVNPGGLSSVLHDQGHQRIVGCLHSKRGGKSVNQDSAVLYQGYGAEDGVFGGVFDGHGRNGHFVSRNVKERLPLLLLNEKKAVENADIAADDDGELESNRTYREWKRACENAFTEMDEEIRNLKKVDASFSGTTAVVILKQGDDLIVANLGDSRAVLGKKVNIAVEAVQLTVDLKPGSPDEANRIIGSNGRVFALPEEPDLERAWLPRVHSPGIAMSRTFGDFVMKKYGIISTPVVTHHHVTSDDLFIVLASDGIWDVLTNEEVVSIVCSAESEEMAAKAVVNAAAAAWRIKVPHDKPDDCTAVCFFLPKNDEAEASTS